MIIQTKLDVGDVVYTVDPKTMKVFGFEIQSILTSSHKEGTKVYLSPKQKSSYSFEQYEEEKCFLTEEELITYMKS